MELRQTKSKVIDGITYEVTQLGAIQGTRVFVRVMHMVGPAIQAKNLAAGFGAALASLKEDDVEWLCQQFSPLTMVKGVGQLDRVFDVHFTGKYRAMLSWLVFCLEVNFSDFLGGKSLESLLAHSGLGTAKSSESTSPSTQTGPSGES